MGKSGALSTSNQYVKYTIEIIENSQSIPNNTSNVTVKVRFYRTNTGYETYGTGTVYCKINGTQYSASVSSSQKITNSGIVLFSKTLTIAHGTDGKKTLTCSAWINLNTPLTSNEQSYSQALSTIPRNAKITKFTVAKLDETKLRVTWDCDVACDKVYYSLNNGSWVEAVGYPSFNITGLQANTTYSVKIRVRRKDNQLTTDSSAVSQTTYNYPHWNSASKPHHTIGERLTLGFYNPLGRTFTIWLILADGTERGGDTIGGTGISGYDNDGWKNYFYKSLPRDTMGRYKVKVVCGTSEITVDKGYTYGITGNEIPTLGEMSYSDTATNVVAITGNNQLIVQNQSNLQVAYTEATPNNGAKGILKYDFVLNGVTKTATARGGVVDFGKVDSANDLELTLTVTDSRGLTATKKMTVKMLAHSAPTASVKLERLNNYEDETHLTVDASIASVDEKNTVTVQYRYKLANGEYGSFVTIPNKETEILMLDKHSIFVVNVKATDAFGTAFNAEYILYKGVFPLFIDTEKNAVGINEFPKDGDALRVAGGAATFEGGIKLAVANENEEFIQDIIVESGKRGIWSYRKWQSGNVDMECVFYNTSAVANSLVEVTIPLPFPVYAIKPYVTCLAGGWALTKPPYFNIYGGNNITEGATELKLYYTAENATSRTYYFAIQVKGTWR